MNSPVILIRTTRKIITPITCGVTCPRPCSRPDERARSLSTGREELYANTDGKKGQYIPDLFTKAAGNFIKANQPDQFNRYRPFFLLLNYTIARPGAGDTMPVPTDAPYSDEPWPQPEKNRAAMIARLDDYIGQLLEQLKSLSIESNTVIFFSSDTGPQTGGGVDPKFFQSAGPFRGQRGDLYEGGLRVPMIVSWPGRIPAGQVSDFPWAAWDFLPTALQIALREPPKNIDGISVLPALLGETQTNRHEFFSWAPPGPRPRPGRAHGRLENRAREGRREMGALQSENRSGRNPDMSRTKIRT